MSLDFKKFNVGTLFLVRTPDVFPEGFADECFKDMKENLHFDFVAHLETWNCEDGILWKSDKFPRSSLWAGEERDPMEECFQAADKYDLAFLPEVGLIHKDFIMENEDAMFHRFDGTRTKYGRIGLSPVYPKTLQYLIEKYDELYNVFGHHKSFQGFCLPSENGGSVSYDKYTNAEWKKLYGTDLPTPSEIVASKELESKVISFLENNFTQLYKKLSAHLKEKYGLPLMQYPLSKMSQNSHHQPTYVYINGNVELMTRLPDLDMMNLQIHPPLNPNPYYHKFETEFLMGNAKGKPCIADTHFYHEGAAGRLPDTTPKRIMDSILSTLTPYGISFFCYGFMAEELPLWKKELNPGAPVFKAYDETNTVKARREMAKTAMDFVEMLRPMLEGTSHMSDCAIYYPESADKINKYYSYPTEHLFGLFELLNAASIPTKVAAEIPESTNEQKALIINSIKEFSSADGEKLKKYIASGGKLILIGKCCKEIEEIAGIKTELSDAEFVRSEESGDYNKCFIRLPQETRHYTEKNGEAVLCYSDLTPAVTKNGNVIYIGFSDEIDRFSYYRDYKLVTWIKAFAESEKISSGVEFHNVHINAPDRHQFISCDLFGNENKKLLFIRNFGVEAKNSDVNWNLPEGFKVSKALCDGKEFEFENGGKLPLFEHFVAVYAEK